MTTDIAAAQARRDLDFARKGLMWALLSGILWGFDGVMLGLILGRPLLADPALWLLAPATVAALSDVCGALCLLAGNAASGRWKELLRTLRSRPARTVALGGLCGGPLGMTAYLMAIKFAGPAYVMPITALYPAVSSVLAGIFLKERIAPRAWLGMLLCIFGATAIGWSAPAGQTGPEFSLGVLLALAATLGWGTEGFLATAAMDLLDPVVALNVRQLVSGLTYLLIVLPLAGGYGLLQPILTHPLGAAVAGVAVLTTISYVSWYRGLNMAGVSRAMAMNVTYSLWGIMFSALFAGLVLTANLTAGAALVTAGMIMVVGNPRNMAKLRNVA